MIRLSIIVPVYNTERYIRPCIESIFKQGLEDSEFEVIIVNDGTKDKSLEMISDIISLHNNVTVINQDNQGLSVARNNGIAIAKGEYIIMPDSDDLLIRNSIRPLLNLATVTKVDLVVANFIKMSDEEIEQVDTTPPQQILFQYKEKTGEELFIQDLDPYHCYVWRTLYRREFLINNKIKFIPRICIEDVPFTHECYLKAKKCICSPWLLNIYRKGHESISYSFNLQKTKDFCTAVARTWDLTHLAGLSSEVQFKLQENVYSSFSMIIWITIHRIQNLSDKIRIIDYLKKEAPDLWFKNGAKQKIASYLYKYTPHWFIYIHCIYAIIVEKSNYRYTKQILRK